MIRINMMMAKGRSSKRTATRSLLGVLVSLLLIIYNLPDGQLASNRTLAADDGNSHFFKYAYVFVTYHKTGHGLSHTLVGYLQNNFDYHFGRRLREGNRVRPRTDFNVLTKCSELSLAPGTVTVIEAPELHCHKEKLAKLLMKNPDPLNPKWGVKIIHLVRNPFSMAVSNFHYHSQDPTPEPFVHWTNPCHSLKEKHIGPGDDVVADLAIPVLSHARMRIPINGELSTRQPIMTREDFDKIVNDCYAIYQTRPGLTNATYYEHLRALDPKEGLRMATTDKFNNFVLMASDLLMFNRVQQLVRERSAKRPWRQQELELITMPMDDWIEQPDHSMYKFLEFVFHDHIPDHEKNTISSRYKKAFLKKSLESNHITTGKSADTAELMESLRGDAVFGVPLTRIEALLGEVLHLESMEQ